MPSKHLRIWITLLTAGLQVAPSIERQHDVSEEQAHEFLQLNKVSAGKSLGGEEWLEQWLYSLEVNIPDIRTQRDGFQINITHGYCHHFKVTAIQSLRHNKAASITARGMAASCSLHWSVQGLSFPHIEDHGDVVATVGNSTLAGVLEVVADEAKECGCSLPIAIKGDQSFCTAAADVQVLALNFSGSITASLLELLTPLLKWGLHKVLGSTICEAVDNAIDTKGSDVIANASCAARRFLNTSSVWPSKPRPLPEPHRDFIDFAGNPAMPLLQQLLERVLTNMTSPHNFNALVRMVSPDGTWSAGKSSGLLPLERTVQLQNLGILNITLHAIALSGLDTLSMLKLKPLESQLLALALAIGNLGVNASIQLDIATGSGPVHGKRLTEYFNISIQLENVSVETAVFLAVNQSKAADLSIDQLADLGCLGPAVTSAMMTQAGTSLPAVRASVTPLEGGHLEKDSDAMLNLVMNMLLDQFNVSVSAIANHAAAVPLRDLINNATAKALTSGGVCPDPEPTYTAPAFSFTMRIAAMGLVIIGMLAFPSGMLAKRRKRRRSAPILDVVQTEITCPDVSQDGREGFRTNHDELVTSLHERFPSAGQQTVRRCCSWDCLAFHPRVHPGFRWGLPILAVTLICLFAASNSGVGTSVHLSVLANGQPVAHLPSLFSFSLLSSVKNMWESQAYLLAGLIAFFSGIWPYVKLLLMLFCWFIPTSKVSAERRQSVLEFLDEWGKWSLMDVFVMVLFMVSFKFDLTAPDSISTLVNEIFHEAGGTAAIHVYIEALPGFYGFVIATLGSLAVGHMMTANHRYALKLAEFNPVALEQQSGRARLCNKMRPPGSAAGRIFVYVPVLAMSVSLILVTVGIWVYSFRFRFEGLASYVIGEEKSVRPFSVISLGLAVPGASSDPSSFSIRSLQIVFLMFAACAVVGYHVILMVLWCVPLSHRLQTHFFVASQVLSAWSGLDVFVVSIFACITQIERVAKEIIGHKCDMIDTLLDKLPIADQIPGPKTCFDVVSELKAGFWILLVSAIISSIMGRLMIARCKSALCLPEPEGDLDGVQLQ